MWHCFQNELLINLDDIKAIYIAEDIPTEIIFIDRQERKYLDKFEYTEDCHMSFVNLKMKLLKI